MSKRTTYNNLYNEGGEGYNPYKKQAESTEPRWSILDSKRDRLIRIMNGTSMQDSRYAELGKELAAVEAEIKIEEEKKNA